MHIIVKLEGSPPVTFTVNENGRGAPFFIMGIRKCGSTMMNKICFALCDINGVHFVDVSNGFFHNNVAAGDWIGEPAVAAVLKPGNAYMGFRNMPVCFQDNPLFEAGRKILLVRDPRDAIVSEYFSNAYSHAIPDGENDEEGARGNLLAKRKIALESTVEDHARKHVPLMKKTFELYRDICADPNLLLLKYEDCIFDKVKMIGKILDHFGWTCSDSSRDILLKSVDVRPQAENPKAFIRKVTPGDHKEKLSPETIRVLNEELAEVLEFYGYAA
jgi:hypothetical protein